jgi:Ca-activated chloride channel family protein
MIFENPGMLWLLLAVPPFLLGFGLWGWKARKEAASLFPMLIGRLKRKHIEKYVLSAVIMALLIVTLALPQIAYTATSATQKTGEIILLVDVSRSMAAQSEPYAPTRLDRVKTILLDIIDSMEELGQVKISLCGFNDIARSHVPLVGVEDYSYLRESIKKVLGINSTPGGDTSLGLPILNVANKFSQDASSKIIIMLSDGEPYYWGQGRVTDTEAEYIEQAIETAKAEGITVITVGVGEIEGAKIPLYDENGDFTGSYVQKSKGIDFVFYLQEDMLKKIASETGGAYFNEKNLEGFIELIEENLVTVDSGVVSEEEEYQSVAHWFILASLPVWVVFIRRHIVG